MKYKFVGTKQDLLDLGFERLYDGEYSIKDWDNIEREGEYAELVFIVEDDGICYFTTTNDEARIAPDADDSDDGEVYTASSYNQMIVDRLYPLDIVCKLFLSGLVEGIEESETK